jgi:proline iminopeptidase
MVLASITTARRSEIEWLYRGVRHFFPEEWERFRAGAPAAQGDDLPAAYARLMDSPDIEVRRRAARSWGAWEDAVLSLEPTGVPGFAGRKPEADLMAFVRICAHYYSHGAWLPEGVLLENAHRLRGIPGVLVHGRHDLSCPLDTAWDLARAWPGARLVAVDDCGHKASPAMHAAVQAAIDQFGRA